MTDTPNTDSEPEAGSVTVTGSASGDAVPSLPVRPAGIRRKYLAFMVAGLVLLVGSGALMIWQVTRHDDTGTGTAAATVGADGIEVLPPVIGADGSIMYVIPNGTRARIAAGDKIAVIPAKLTVKVGQTLILRNEDDDTHIAGPFFVGPGEDSTYTFSEPKVIEGDCTIHPSGHFEIDVVK